ncbi:hypothetical protein ACP70R_040815 [Stipagrostis hirtigluma subsp. patula]
MAMTTAACGVSFPARPAGAAAGSVRPRAGAGVVRAGAAEGGGKWWAPLLGWSGRADYIEAPAAVEEAEKAGVGRRAAFVGGLTEEKARELRARMVETESFHDAMYHSAIASRLARSA